MSKKRTFFIKRLFSGLLPIEKISFLSEYSFMLGCKKFQIRSAIVLYHQSESVRQWKTRYSPCLHRPATATMVDYKIFLHWAHLFSKFWIFCVSNSLLAILPNKLRHIVIIRFPASWSAFIESISIGQRQRADLNSKYNCQEYSMFTFNYNFKATFVFYIL